MKRKTYFDESPRYVKRKVTVAKPFPGNDLLCSLEKRRNVSAYKEEVLEESNRLKAKLNKYLKDPESHPRYRAEWKIFWDRKAKKLALLGESPSKYNFKNEWCDFFIERIYEIYEEDKMKRLEDIKKKYHIKSGDLERSRRKSVDTRCIVEAAISNSLEISMEQDNLKPRGQLGPLSSKFEALKQTSIAQEAAAASLRQIGQRLEELHQNATLHPRSTDNLTQSERLITQLSVPQLPVEIPQRQATVPQRRVSIMQHPEEIPQLPVEIPQSAQEIPKLPAAIEQRPVAIPQRRVSLHQRPAAIPQRRVSLHQRPAEIQQHLPAVSASQSIGRFHREIVQGRPTILLENVPITMGIPDILDFFGNKLRGITGCFRVADYKAMTSSKRVYLILMHAEEIDMMVRWKEIFMEGSRVKISSVMLIQGTATLNQNVTTVNDFPYSMFLGNLEKRGSETTHYLRELAKLFGARHTITGIRICHKLNAKAPRTFGFVTFMSKSFIDVFNGRSFDMFSNKVICKQTIKIPSLIHIDHAHLFGGEEVAWNDEIRKLNLLSAN